MSAIDSTLFADVADALGIKNPAIVEKDYYAVQLLNALVSLSFDDYDLVFSGGTCLAKAYKNTYRMSEDIDIKCVPSSSMSYASRDKKRQKRRNIQETIISFIDSSPHFQLIDCKKRNEGKYQQFLIKYPINYPKSEALRPHLQLELTESVLLMPAIDHSIGSLYAKVAQQEAEINNLPCAAIESIVSEKFVALLRRVAAFARDNTKEDDETLIRHVYDLHLIRELISDLGSIGKLVDRVIQIDVEQFGSHSKEFRDNPVEELKYGLKILAEKELYKERYEKFIGPLVYHPEPASWNEAINTISKLSTIWLD